MRLDVAAKTAEETRARLQAEAREAGVTEEYISVLVDTFYARVRAHPELGPVFEAVVEDRWGQHLEKMKRFWGSVALRKGSYGGDPMAAHLALKDARPEHFPMWLELFEQTLQETAPGPAAVEHFMKLARAMASRLCTAMFQRPCQCSK